MDKHERSHKHSHSHSHSHSHNHSHGHKHSHKHSKAVLNRLARASGHLTSIRNMVEGERDCSEVLVQLAAVRGAINKISEIVLRDHLEHCIIEAAESGDKEALNKISRAIELLFK